MYVKIKHGVNLNPLILVEQNKHIFCYTRHLAVTFNVHPPPLRNKNNSDSL